MEVLLLELSMDFLGSLSPLVLLQVGWYSKFLSMFQHIVLMRGLMVLYIINLDIFLGSMVYSMSGWFADA